MSKPNAKPGTRQLTLADVEIVRTVGDSTERISGADLARLIDASGPPGRREELTNNGMIADEVMGIANLVGAVSVATFEGYSCDSGLLVLQLSLQPIADRIQPVAPAENGLPQGYRICQVTEDRA